MELQQVWVRSGVSFSVTVLLNIQMAAFSSVMVIRGPRKPARMVKRATVVTVEFSAAAVMVITGAMADPPAGLAVGAMVARVSAAPMAGLVATAEVAGCSLAMVVMVVLVESRPASMAPAVWVATAETPVCFRCGAMVAMVVPVVLVAAGYLARTVRLLAPRVAMGRSAAVAVPAEMAAQVAGYLALVAMAEQAAPVDRVVMVGRVLVVKSGQPQALTAVMVGPGVTALPVAMRATAAMRGRGAFCCCGTTRESTVRAELVAAGATPVPRALAVRVQRGMQQTLMAVMAVMAVTPAM